MENKVDIKRVAYFVRIIDAGNLTRAAKFLNEPKAKLSRNLALLEEEVGVQLVYRTTRQFKLTEAGLRFYNQAKEHIEGLYQSISLLTNQDDQLSGKLRITAPEDLGLHVITKLIDDFSKLHPLLSFDVIYTNEVLDLVKEGIDVAFRMGKLKDSSLIQKRIGSIEFIVVSSSRYLKKVNPPSEIADIHQHELIGFQNREWLLYNKTKPFRAKLKYKINTNNPIAARDLVIGGHGIACLPKFICQDSIKSGELIHLFKQWGDNGPQVQITVPHQKNMSKKVRMFFDFAAKNFTL